MSKPKFQVFKDKRGEFRWRYLTSNGRIIAVSSESYKRLIDCMNGLELLANFAATAEREKVN